MFDGDYFKDVINETTTLMLELDNVEQENKEEIQAKVDANILTLKILADEIEDDDLRSITLKRIDMLFDSPGIVEVSFTKSRSKDDVNNVDDAIHRQEKDILSHSKTLKGKAKKLLDSLKVDENVLTDTSGKMERNLVDTSSNIKKLKEGKSSFSTFGVLVFTIAIFFIMYFIIKSC